jgi:hypothetical protein
MKKIITLFLLLTTISFAIPDFEKLQWGFNIDAIKGFYPDVKKEFTTSEGVTKFSTHPEDSNKKTITFYLFQNQLYKIITEFDPTKVQSDDVSSIFNKYVERFGTPTASLIDETYSDFTIKGNEQTWVVNSTYISFIGQDYFDKENRLNNSKLIMEYGLIDPKNRKNNSILNDLILKD